MAQSIHCEPHPAGGVVTVAGEADAMAAGALEDALRAAFVDALARDNKRTIIVDLSGASFIDSRMIGVLVDWVEKLEARGWRLPIVCSDPNMLRVFDLIGLQSTFTFSDSREAAVDG